MSTVRYILVFVRLMLSLSLVLGITSPVYAANSFIVMKKSVQDYANAMSSLQMDLEQKHFKVEFVQRVDIGLAKAGYHTDKYRIIFFMPVHGVKRVLSRRADLADMFPFKLTVYRDKGKVYVFGIQNARLLDASVPADIRKHFQAWDKQIDTVVENVF